MARFLVILVTATAGLAVAGVWIAFERPTFPLLSYWLVLALGAGIAVAWTPAIEGLAARARWILWINAPLAALALWTTQIAARRATSAIHLRYRGVHVTGRDTLVIGVGDPRADIVLERVSGAEMPWSIRVVRDGSRWRLEPIAGVEQLRVTLHGGEHAASSRYDVAGAAVLEPGAPGVVVVGPDSRALDTLALSGDRVTSSAGNVFELEPRERILEARWARRLRAGTALATLDGIRAVPSLYERFVRVQVLGDADIVDGERVSWLKRWAFRARRMLPFGTPGAARLLVSAAPPFHLAGSSVATEPLVVDDSALVDARNADASWRFELRVWRHQPSAPVGLALLFVRNPRPLDTPLPAGTSCRPGAACGALSLRALPPPISQITLAGAGFDTAKFGLLARVRPTETGVGVVLPEASYRIDRGDPHPTAIPVSALAPDSRTPRTGAPGPRYWVLLGATGTYGDDASRILMISMALFLLLAGIQGRIVAAARSEPTRVVRHERTLALGLATLLALLLARLILGARVAFFAPFEDRAIETAVGMWVAIAVVAMALLAWQRWVPPILVAGRAIMAGRVGTAVTKERVRSVASSATSAIGAGIAPIAVVSVATALLWLAVRSALWHGLVAGAVVSLTWACLAWTAAFSGRWFETFERGAWSVVEHVSPATRPELSLIVACLAAEFSQAFPASALGIASVVVLVGCVLALRRRRAAAAYETPDLVAVALGVALFCIVIAVLRLESENGSMGAFVLVILVALAGVRIGRAVGARLADSTSRSLRARLLDAALLFTPVLLLAPLMALDMGLFLVVVVPVGVATLLAADLRVAGRWASLPVAGFLVLALVARAVLWAPVSPIRAAESHAAQAAEFDGMSRLFGLPLPGAIATSFNRAAARSVATRDQDLAERLLVAARPGPARDLLMPSIEQIWGAQTYAQAGWFGEGLGQAVVGGRGVAETVSYAENAFSVFILAEHGAVGGMVVLSLYLLLLVAVLLLSVRDDGETPAAYRASRALFIVASLLLVVPACYVALSNLGVVPITGQNMPFLGLNAWSDVALCAGVVGILITGAIRGVEEVGR